MQDPAILSQALCKKHLQVPPLQKWSRKHFVSGSVRLTPSFPLVHKESTTYCHTKKATKIPPVSAHPFKKEKNSGGGKKGKQRTEIESVLHSTRAKDDANLEIDMKSR